MNRFLVLSFFVLFILVQSSVAQTFPEQTNYPPYASGINGHVTDLCLIYCARPYPMVPYNKETMKKYLVYSDNGQTRFLYDGFILLDIRSTTNQPLENNPLAATQAEWTLLMNRYFEEGWAASAIDQALEDLRAQNIVPLRKRKIYMGIPVPYEHKFAFGNINGKRLTMETVENRTLAAKWYVDEVLRRWKEKKYKNIELAGFYWVEEHARENGDLIIPKVSEYVKSKGYRMVWVPYYGSNNAFAKHWKSLGFDMAYQQPNYFFVSATRLGVPVTRLNDATKFASDNGMAVEFEFDHNVFDTLYQRKFTEYVDYFERNKVFERSAIAYYEGGGAWSMIADTDNPAVKVLYHRLASLIAERQRKADSIYIHRKEITDGVHFNEDFQELPGDDWSDILNYRGWQNTNKARYGRNWLKKTDAAVSGNTAMMGYSRSMYSADSWMISPQIDLTDSYFPELQFDFARGYYENRDCLQLLISDEFKPDSDPTLHTKWKDSTAVLRLGQLPVHSGYPDRMEAIRLNLLPYSGKKIHLAFRYQLPLDGSKHPDAPLYLVDNIRLEESRVISGVSTPVLSWAEGPVPVFNNKMMKFPLPVEKVSLHASNGSLVRHYASTDEVSLRNLKGFYILNYTHEAIRYSRKLVLLQP